MCQLEGSDHGGRDSAAELALAGSIDVNVGRLLQPADFGVSLPDAANYTPAELPVNDFIRRRVIYFTFGRADRICMRKSASLSAFDTLPGGFYTADSSIAIGQVAQLVERGPEKAGVGGSIPSLATT